jgi:predicted nicotinamide N-methyase
VSLDRRAFILRHTRLQRPPHAPELQLHLADEIEPVWRMSEEALGGLGVPPPFWAFAWAGGQALARYLLDHPHEVAGKRVLDVAAGSGLVAIAAMKAGAMAATANDLDPYCPPAIALNAEANGVEVAFLEGDLLGAPPPGGFDLITAGDVCYEKPFTDKIMPWLEAARAAGTRVLIGDPGRSYFPKTGLRRLADYQVETTRELEDAAVKRTGVWTFVGD